MKDICPCYGCKDRKAATNTTNACHSTCYERYIPWVERQEKKKARLRKEKEAENTFVSHNIDSEKRNEKLRKTRHKR